MAGVVTRCDYLWLQIFRRRLQVIILKSLINYVPDKICSCHIQFRRFHLHIMQNYLINVT